MASQEVVLAPKGILTSGKARSVGGGRGRWPRRDRALFSSNESDISKQILATHASNIEDLNMVPVLSIVEDIVHLGWPSEASASPEAVISIGDDHESEIITSLAFPICKINCEIISKCAFGGEAHSLTMDLLRLLSNYSWDAKVVITFAAFAASYGEFWLVNSCLSKEKLAEGITTIKDLPHVTENIEKLQKVSGILNTILKVTHCLVDFKKLPSAYIDHDSTEYAVAKAQIPSAAYWSIRSLLACAPTFLNLVKTTDENIDSNAESSEMESLAEKLLVISKHLQGQLAVCKKLVERKKVEHIDKEFKKLIESSHVDNMEVLGAMINSEDGQRQLYDGIKKTIEGLEVLRSMYVLFLITDLDIPQEQLSILHLIYNDQPARGHNYGIVWVPVVDPTSPMTEPQDRQLHDLQNSMPWYSVRHPSFMKAAAIRYIRDELKFVHMPMLRVLDPHGKLSETDAKPMMWIWGTAAFPFTKDQELRLWKDQTWNMELLVDGIDPRILEWIAYDKVICLYGGKDIEWIRKFTRATRAAATALHLPLEMLYVGKCNPKDKVRRCHEIIHMENLSHVFSPTDYYDFVWYFWVRLWSMWDSRKQAAVAEEKDPIMQQLMEILTYDSSDRGWAIFSRGKYEMTMGRGEVVLPVMERYETWADKVGNPNGLVVVVGEEIRQTAKEHRCSRLILPDTATYIPRRLICTGCGKTMEPNVMYRCCPE